ncbi:MAG TPA: hypothetical protein VMW24_05205 [Sedimentisphaerales bacterium]|nr:hypothetical protein [Sedimentisphaerales bacterium]
MTLTTTRDYAESGLTIREAMLDHAKRFPNKAKRPDHILWAGHRIKTADVFHVPQRGIVRAEFLSAMEGVEQGFDIQLDGGWVELEQGEHVPHLRTWKDKDFDDVVEYPFFSPDERLWVWNVYKMKYPGGQIVEEKWTENAGFWIEHISENERIYHCSHGMATPPDFDSLVFKVRVNP